MALLLVIFILKSLYKYTPGDVCIIQRNKAPKSREILKFVCLQKDAKQCCDATTPESIHTKDESKRGLAFAFIFGVN